MPCPGMVANRIRILRRGATRLTGIAVLALAATLPAATVGATSERAGREGRAKPLVFGIYPGGGAGTVGPAGQTRPEVAELRRDALLRLRPSGRPFVLHLYDEFTTRADARAVPGWLADQIDDYSRQGFKIELVLRYRPQRRLGDVRGFERFVRARVRQLGSDRNLTHLQVTNEANITVAPDAADGAYRGARRALVRGVVAAKREARRRGHRRLRIGFNWADEDRRAGRRFFSALRREGGRRFARSVDWVGVDAYPGTWGPALPPGELDAAVGASIERTLRTLRRDLLPRAGLRRARLHFSETGFPTGVDRSEAMQRTVMQATIRTVSRLRRRYGVTDLRWFDLRDADSSNPSFESQYGIMRDDYSPKAAFGAFRALVRRLG